MKTKQTLVASVAAIAVSLTAYHGAASVMQRSNDNNALLMENIEALTKNPEEVTITCSKGHQGQCFYQGTKEYMCGEHFYRQCEYSGFMADHCYKPC